VGRPSDLVPVATEQFDAVLGKRPNQVEREREDVHVEAADLLDVASTPGEVTEAGVRGNIAVAIAYIDSWLHGNGAAAINNLMEDAATAEISRSQVWQWKTNRTTLADGRAVTPELLREWMAESPEGAARETFEQVALGDELADFLTLAAYDRLR
jgi:malate synthase